MLVKGAIGGSTKQLNISYPYNTARDELYAKKVHFPYFYDTLN